MDVIVNPKSLDGGLNIIQLETGVGYAMECFKNSISVNIPRSRFLPVKKTCDLLLIMSNLYNLSNGFLSMSPNRMIQATPLVQLDDENFKSVDDFAKRFAHIPNIVGLDRLTVSGNVHFGKDVVLKGIIVVSANHGDQLDIPDGMLLENNIVSQNSKGNLRILDYTCYH